MFKLVGKEKGRKKKKKRKKEKDTFDLQLFVLQPHQHIQLLNHQYQMLLLQKDLLNELQIFQHDMLLFYFILFYFVKIKTNKKEKEFFFYNHDLLSYYDIALKEEDSLIFQHY